jgi:hypothetical protein
MQIAVNFLRARTGFRRGSLLSMVVLGSVRAQSTASRICGSLRLVFAYTLPMSRYDRPSHQVYMYFFNLQSGWLGDSVPGAKLEDSLPRKLTFADPEKIRELARRGEAWGTSEAKQMLEHAIETGRGGIYLRLSSAQYARLKQITPS